jgi:hypothetical protein
MGAALGQSMRAWTAEQDASFRQFLAAGGAKQRGIDSAKKLAVYPLKFI